MRRLPSHHVNSRVHRERDINALSRLALLLLCGLVLAGGFLFAARQYFVAIQYGYRIEDLRRERRRLLDEQQRLFLAKEQASSPVRIESAARDLGLQPLQPGQIETLKTNVEGQPHPAPALINPSASLHR
jgi:cell division protein FtsL